MPKSRVPMLFAKLLEADRLVTTKFCDGVAIVCPEINRSYRVYLKLLEISCHGLPWLCGTLIWIYLLRSIETRESQINLLFGLLYDIMIVAFVKALVRRRRPSVGGRENDMFLTIGVDKFSFPSGHATRAIFLSLFFSEWAYPNQWVILKACSFIWATAVCVSRVLLHRHHILDVAAGVVIGYLEFLVVGVLWIGPTGSRVIGDWISTTAEDEYN